ncbi:prefoldin subunit 5-like [Dendronephthya gigantea]|uniref:prefoldin subunit 5-like n=1 Tax=Dendronephthya gigantea TaxID=151771 RepID=UPI00106CB5DD|nr:prefoldin subunit 5-like [Dendronephthya gigantea]
MASTITAGPQSVELSRLPLPQLDNFKAVLDEEIRILSESASQLKIAQQKFVDSREAIKKLHEKKGTEVLVPLTASLYAPGHLEGTDNVLVDIGTGYFASKSLEGAEKYFERKIEYLTKQIEKIQPGLIEKHRIRQAVIDTMSAKVKAAQMTNQVPIAKA